MCPVVAPSTYAPLLSLSMPADQPGAALISLQGGAVKTVASYKTASAVSAPFAATAGEVMAVVTVEEAGRSVTIASRSAHCV